MHEIQLISVAARRQGEELVTQANAHRGNTALEGRAQRRNGWRGHLGIAGAIGDQDAVESEVAGWPKEIIVPGYRDYAHLASDQAAHDVAFGPAIDEDDRG